MAHDVQHWSNQRSEIQQRFPAQMWFLDDLYISRIRRQHPNGNLQTPSGGIQHCDRAVSSLGFADDLNAKAAKRMEWIENTNLLGFCAQGIVSVVASILTFTCSSPPEACLRTGSPGSIPNIHFFSFPTLLCRISSALNSVPVLKRQHSFDSLPQPSGNFAGSFIHNTLAVAIRFSTISAVTCSGSLSPTAVWNPSTTASSVSATVIIRLNRFAMSRFLPPNSFTAFFSTSHPKA